MSHESQFTVDHDKIRRWVEARKGRPACIADTQRDDDDVGLLRIDFPGGAGNPPLEPISWDDFFDKFEEANLAFLYQEKTEDGDPSYFCKFVSREHAEAAVLR